MHRFPSTRFVVIALAACSMVTVPLAGAAAAAAPTTCDNPKIVTSVSKGTVTFTLTNCSNKAATGGGGTAVVSLKSGGLAGKITWNGTGTTTFTRKSSTATVNKCKAPLVEIVTTGRVTGGSGRALKLIPKGSPFSEMLCANKTTGVTTILKGTKVVI